MKTLSTLFFALLLSACATTHGENHDYAAPQVIKIDGASINVTGDLLTPYEYNEFSGAKKWSRHLMISFNGKPVIDGFLSNPRDVSGELNGEYQGKALNAVCNSVTANNALAVNCMLLVDNQRAVTLTF